MLKGRRLTNSDGNKEVRMQGAGAGILYSETQYFRQFWLWILLLGIAALSIWSVLQQLISGGDFGNNPAPDAVLR